MSSVRLICLGNEHVSDDGAALRAADSLVTGRVMRAGRPGASLIDLLEGSEPVVLVDVTQSGARPGTIHEMSMRALQKAALAQPNVSSHGFGPAEALELAEVLGRPLAPGHFVGIEGARFTPGDELSDEVQEAMPRFVDAIERAIAALE